ncbi:MAG: alpha/beta hydrolase [Gammaproteobacteria bacterium]|nr:alpha/beta hydrolase [Gammaproteobacteria bacterium]
MKKQLILGLTALSLLSSQFAIASETQSSLSQEVQAFDARLSQYSYPFPVEFYEFKSQGQVLEMAYMYLPAAEGKPTVTLLHGKNFTAAYWKDVAQWLHEQGYGVFMPDQIGFGKSSKPTDYQYSFAGLANNTQAVMKSLGIKKTILVGHSMGGMLASRFSLMSPDFVAQLVLVNPIGLENYLQYVEYKDPSFFEASELKKTAKGIDVYQQKNYYDGAWNEIYDALTLPLKGWLKGPDWPQIAKVNALTYDMIFTQPVISEFKDLDVPVSLILGTRDRTGPGRGWKKQGVHYELGRYDQLGEYVKQQNPHINVYEIDGIGHLPQIEAPKEFRAIFQQDLKSQ